MQTDDKQGQLTRTSSFYQTHLGSFQIHAPMITIQPKRKKESKTYQ